MIVQKDVWENVRKCILNGTIKKQMVFDVGDDTVTIEDFHKAQTFNDLLFSKIIQPSFAQSLTYVVTVRRSNGKLLQVFLDVAKT